MASQIATELEDTVRRVPMIGWVALAGGAALFVFARHNSTAANILNPNAATPNVDSGALPGQVFPPDTGGSVTAGTTPDPGSTAVVPPPDYHQKTTDILGGTLGHFIAGLTNQPDFVNYTSGDQSITESSGVATYGGGGGNPLISPEDVANRMSLNNAYHASDLAYNLGIHQSDQAANIANHAADMAYATALGLPPPQAQPTGMAGIIARFLGPPVDNPTPTPQLIGPPVVASPAPSNYWGNTSCGSGNYSCIRGACHSGDTACAHSVAPWWRGDAIGGW